MKSLNKRLREKFHDKEYRQTYSESFQNSWIASQIKALREQRGMTQGELAELAGMHQPRISVLEDVNYESWNVGTLRRLANAFDVDLHVQFVPFSKTVFDADTFSVESLRVPAFKDDPFFKTDKEKLNNILFFTSATHPEAAIKEDSTASFPSVTTVQSSVNQRVLLRTAKIGA
jgi:transcriptional regulator with XRE-family HTH domain